MLFTLEILRAKHGDCLLLHYGSSDAPQLIVIDGGPAGVFKNFLGPRLDQLRGDKDSLRAKMLMVSHIDDDHIRGVLDMMRKLQDDDEEGRALRYRFGTVWHNSFDDLIGNHSQELLDEVTDELGGAASLDGEISTTAPVSGASQLLLASVGQGRKLRAELEALGIASNQTPKQDGGLLVARAGAESLDMGDGLKFNLIGPSATRVTQLQGSWDRYLEKKGLGQQPEGANAAEYLDKSVFNLASIVVLAEIDDKTMLLTGDARGDDILIGAHDAGLLDDEGRLHVDILKIPHHGSDRNVETDFFRRITADHYVFSGDGRHGNPEVATFQMLFAARGVDADPFTLYLTYPVKDFVHHYPVDTLNQFFEQAQQQGHRFEVVTPAADDLSMSIALLDDTYP